MKKLKFSDMSRTVLQTPGKPPFFTGLVQWDFRTGASLGSPRARPHRHSAEDLSGQLWKGSGRYARWLAKLPASGEKSGKDDLEFATAVENTQDCYGLRRDLERDHRAAFEA